MRVKEFAFALASSAALIFAVPAQATTLIDFGVVGIGGTPSYSGANLESSTSFDFDGSLAVVSQVGVGDQSGLTTFPTGSFNTVSLTSPVTYGPGNSGPLSSPLVETWTGAFGTFTETLTSFSVARTGTDSITLDLSGTLAGPGGLSEAAFAILGANQSGGPGNAISWALTDTTVNPTPLPASLPLFATGIGILGLCGWHRKRKTQTAAI